MAQGQELRVDGATVLAIVKLALVNHGISEVQLRADGWLVGDRTHELLSVTENLFAVPYGLETVGVDGFLEVLERIVDVFDQGRQSLEATISSFL